MKNLIFIVLGIFVSLTGLAGELGYKRAWDRISDPLLLSVSQRANSLLPLSGTVSDPTKYWSSDFWSKKKGGINFRWNAVRPTGLNLRSPSKDQAARMSIAELSTLAATEKLDLLSGSYDYPLKREIARYANPSAPSWEGICNGWSEASMHHSEPMPITLTNPDGISIPFGSSDIKALLSWYYFRKSADGYARMGSRCRNKSDSCNNDLNAGAFHLVLTNRLGIQGESFIADIDRGSEVWNHTAYRYQSTVRDYNLRPRRSSARGTRSVMRIRTVVDYTFVLKKNSWEPVLGTTNQKFDTRTYEYYLEMDAYGVVIGGEWISRERPDFIWLSTKTPEFTGNMTRLGDLL